MNNPDITRLYNLVTGSMKTQAIYVAVELGIPDLLASKSQTLTELNYSVKAKPEYLQRLLRALCSLGIFREKLGVYELGNMGELLCAEHPGGLRSYILLLGQPLWWGAWGNLLSAVKEGGSAFENTYGHDFFSHMIQDAVTRDLFHDFMRNISMLNAEAILAKFPFNRYATIVDIGGSQGELLCSILRANSECKGILFDLPEVLPDKSAFENNESNLAERIECVSGDFFKSIPPGADLYVMQQIMHDWDDDDAKRILENCKDAMITTEKNAVRNAGRLLILDAVIGDGNQPDFNKLTDLHMMVLGNGARERSRDEFEILLSSVGLILENIITTGTAFSIVVAKLARNDCKNEIISG